MKKYGLFFVLISVLFLVACDKVNNASRAMDTMLGGDFIVYVQGIDQPFTVKNGKVTAVPEKGYYVFYPEIDGKERLVQSPIQITTIIKMD
ncbi:MAG: major membrane immunogen (membrane-anchored lipoprotein) [Pseudohongiellaceae bacterium]|jgi:major membrane immunogen (membrane-anchored lipoprotein)